MEHTLYYGKDDGNRKEHTDSEVIILEEKDFQSTGSLFHGCGVCVILTLLPLTCAFL